MRLTLEEMSRVHSSFLETIKPFVDMKVGVMLRNVPPIFAEKVSGGGCRLVGAAAWDDLSWLPERERVIMEGAERAIAQIEENFRKTYGYVVAGPRDDEPVKVGQIFHPGMMVT